MAQPLQDATRTVTALRRILKERIIGALSIDEPSGPLVVQLYRGRIVSAESEDDTRAVMLRLLEQKQIASRRAAALTDDGAPVFEALLDEVPPEVLAPVLLERFRANLARFCDTDVRPQFALRTAVYASNFHLHLDPEAELERATGGPRDRVPEQAAAPATPPEPASPTPVPVPARRTPSRPQAARSPTLDPVEAPTEEVARATSPAPPRSASDVEIDDEVLEAFADHDEVRGNGEGAFSTEEHLLDRVEVGGAERKTVPNARAKFSAPVLSENEARGKLRVANEVLVVLAATYDAELGRGRGREQLQLLCEGAPARYTDIFAGIVLGPDGALPHGTLLQNLSGRASTEHRAVLHQALLDLLERALSVAADELPDEALDQVLERVAGYRQRMGL